MSSPTRSFRYLADYSTVDFHGDDWKHAERVRGTWLFTAENGNVTATLYAQTPDGNRYDLPEGTLDSHPGAFWGPLDESLALGSWNLGSLDNLESFLRGYTDAQGQPFSEDESPGGQAPRRFIICDANDSRAYMLTRFTALETPRVLDALGARSTLLR